MNTIKRRFIIKASTYTPEATLSQIIEDGWARGLEPKQTVEEAEACGYIVTIAEVKFAWSRKNIDYQLSNGNTYSFNY